MWTDDEVVMAIMVAVKLERGALGDLSCAAAEPRRAEWWEAITRLAQASGEEQDHARDELKRLATEIGDIPFLPMEHDVSDDLTEQGLLDLKRQLLDVQSWVRNMTDAEREIFRTGQFAAGSFGAWLKRGLEDEDWLRRALDNLERGEGLPPR